VLQRQWQPNEVQENERSIKLIIKEQLPEDFQILKDEVIINKLHYIFPPLKSFSKKILNDIAAGKIIYKTTKPDLDSNLNKGLFDAMEGIIFLNDSQVCEIKDMKKYYGFEPRSEIEIQLTKILADGSGDLFS
jgi:Holliday junction resolvase RusA-like endonuclease